MCVCARASQGWLGGGGAGGGHHGPSKTHKRTRKHTQRKLHSQKAHTLTGTPTGPLAPPPPSPLSENTRVLAHAHTYTMSHTRRDCYDKECVLRCAKKTREKTKGARPQRTDEDRGVKNKNIMPTTVPFIPELEQRASNQKA